MEYYIKMVYTKKDFVKYMYICKQKKAKNKFFLLVSYISNIISTLSLLTTGGISLYFFFGLIRIERSVGCIFLLPFSLMLIVSGCLLLLTNSCKLLGHRAWKNYFDKDSLITYCFSPNCFTRWEPNYTYNFPYDSIKCIYEDDNAYYLFYDNRSAHIVLKRGLDDRLSLSFPYFLSSVTNLSILKSVL